MANRAVISDPLYCAPSTIHPERQAGNDAIANRKVLRRGMRAQREFADDRPAPQYFLVQLLVFFGVANIDARPKHSDGPPMSIHRSLVRDGINPPRPPADNDQSARRQFSSQPLSHLCPRSEEHTSELQSPDT